MHEQATGALHGSLVVTVTGTILGAHVDALLIGLMAAVLVTILMPAIDSRAKAFAAVLLSSMAAGYLSPVLVPWVAGHVDHASGASTESIRLLLAGVIGSAGPVLVPIAIKRLRQKAEEVAL